MNKIFVFGAALFTALSLQAQGIKSGTLWYDGYIDYEATVRQDGSVLMEAMAEGQEMEFVLVPKEGQPGAYTAPAEDEAVYVGGAAAAVEPDADHYAEKQYEQKDFQKHGGLPLFLDF